MNLQSGFCYGSYLFLARSESGLMEHGSILPFQPFSLVVLADNTSVAIGGSKEQAGTLALTRVSHKIDLVGSTEFPAAVMKLSCSTSGLIASCLHLPFCFLYKILDEDLAPVSLGRIMSVPQQYEQMYSEFHPTNSLLATAGANNTLSLWLLVPNSPKEPLQLLSKVEVPSTNSLPTISAISWSTDGKAIAVAGNSIYLYGVKNNKLENFYNVTRTGNCGYDYRGCVFTDDSTLFAFKRHTTPKSSSIVKFKVGIGRYVSQVKESTFLYGAHHSVFHLDESKSRIVFGTVRGEIIVVCCNTLEVLHRFKPHTYCITGITFARDHQTGEEVIMSCGLDKRLVYTKLTGNKRVRTPLLHFGIAAVCVLCCLIFVM